MVSGWLSFTYFTFVHTNTPWLTPRLKPSFSSHSSTRFVFIFCERLSSLRDFLMSSSTSISSWIEDARSSSVIPLLLRWAAACLRGWAPPIVAPLGLEFFLSLSLLVVSVHFTVFCGCSRLFLDIQDPIFIALVTMTQPSYSNNPPKKERKVKPSYSRFEN